MGRKTTFDVDRAVDRATRLFWARGYSGTSLRDLLGVMRIGESSFYHAFGGKAALYRRCLAHYNDTVTRRRWDALVSERSIRRGVRRYFEAVLDDLDDPRTPNVCLMAGSLARDVLSLRGLRAYVLAEMDRLGDGLVTLFDEAAARGELPRDFDSRTTALVLVTFLQGLFRVMRTLVDRAVMEAQIEQLLAGLRL